jgi:HSP20 family molecular chaperone IbpA
MKTHNYNPNIDPVWHLLDKWQQTLENRSVKPKVKSEQSAWNAPQATWKPLADIQQRDNHFLITLDVPGVAPSALAITMAQGVLSVTGTREVNKTKPDHKQWQHHERPYGSFLRQFNVPLELADIQHITAKISQGVLTITIPRKIKRI